MNQKYIFHFSSLIVSKNTSSIVRDIWYRGAEWRGGVGWTHGALNIAIELEPTFLGSHHHFTRALDLLSFDRRVYYLFFKTRRQSLTRCTKRGRKAQHSLCTKRGAGPLNCTLDNNRSRSVKCLFNQSSITPHCLFVKFSLHLKWPVKQYSTICSSM